MTTLFTQQFCGYRDLPNEVSHDLFLHMKIFQNLVSPPQKCYLGSFHGFLNNFIGT